MDLDCVSHSDLDANKLGLLRSGLGFELMNSESNWSNWDMVFNSDKMDFTTTLLARITYGNTVDGSVKGELFT